MLEITSGDSGILLHKDAESYYKDRSTEKGTCKIAFGPIK